MTIKPNTVTDTEADIANQIVKRKSNGKNSPVIGNNGYDLDDSPESKSLVRRIHEATLEAYRMPKVKSDIELIDRLDNYFERCAQKEIKPTVEELCLYCGYTVQGFWDIEHGRSGGFSPATSEIIKKAKVYLSTFDAGLLVEGKLNPVSYIFRAKNYYGMKDVQDVILTPNNPLGPGSDPATIQKQIDSLPEATIDVSDYAAEVPPGRL